MHDAVTLISVVLLVIFCADIVVSFFVGYHDKNGVLVMNHKRIVKDYAK